MGPSLGHEASPKHLWMGGTCFVSFLPSFSILWWTHSFKTSSLQKAVVRLGAWSSWMQSSPLPLSLVIPAFTQWLSALCFGISWGNFENSASRPGSDFRDSDLVGLRWSLCIISVIVRAPYVIVNHLNPIGLRPLPRTRISRSSKG